MHTNTSAIFLAKLLSVALFALMVPVSSLAQQVIYVSPQGNDQLICSRQGREMRSRFRSEVGCIT